MRAFVQATVAQAGSAVLAAQTQPQPVTPWQPLAGTPPGNLSLQASIPTPATNAAYKESWYSNPGRWCKPSNQDPVTGPGQHCSLHSTPCSCPNRLRRQSVMMGGGRPWLAKAWPAKLAWWCIRGRFVMILHTHTDAQAGSKNDCHSQGQGQQAKAALYGTGARSDGKPCFVWTSQAAACGSWHVGHSGAFRAQGSWFPVLSSAATALQTTQARRRAAGRPASSAATP